MNYITKLKNENEQLKKGIESAIEELIHYQSYFNSSKFQGTENDFAHVKTDVYIKITSVKKFLQSTLNSI